VAVVQPNVTFGDTELGEQNSAVSIDTFTIAVNRSESIDSAKIIWRSACRIADTGQPAGPIASGVASVRLEGSSTDLAVDGRIDCADMARLAERWLWVGPANGVPEDIAADGIVDFADFAELAEEWKK